MDLSAAEKQNLEAQLEPLSRSLNDKELVWASGYLAGAASARGGAVTTAAASATSETLTIWYGSETGNGRGVAERLAAEARSHGYTVELASSADIQPRSIAKVSVLLLVMSTHGEGDPPEDAEALHKLIQSERAPRLDSLRYAVFALGDSSYPDFCQTGRDFDARLDQLGATRLLDRVDVDVDFEPAEDQWRNRVLEKVGEVLQTGGAATPHLQLVQGTPGAQRFDRRNPYQAEVLEIAPLTVSPSTSPVHHVELLLEDSTLQWQPGDSVGIWPRNDARLVDEIIAVCKLDGDAVVARKGESLSVSDWLGGRLELTQLARPFLDAWCDLSRNSELRAILDNRDALSRWVAGHQVIDVLREYPAEVDGERFVNALRGIAPRLYSIASSPLEYEDEVHLTVKRVGGLNARQQLRAGVASWQLTETVQPGQRVPVYIESNPRFRLPEDPSRPIIMIGPGTGVAPFRAFIQQRRALGGSGENWLFFGARNRSTDFLYQIEWQRYCRQGGLDRLSVAFSRDQENKIYVQQRIREQGRELFDWLERGAHVYVCGDGQAMAVDVHQALAEVVAEHAGLDAGRAEAYLETMKTDKRYQKDVY
ncbi:MAG: assimilatory sulfite reductase (NADPH) flavoprotein subunit [Xanthomonadaceae bacterium]|nr:assimilatory sulfite reductase (NADPH) flavoprotein subunit [Xanthomonadaceae bacterium]